MNTVSLSPSWELQHSEGLPSLAFILERVTKVEGKEFLQRQAASTTIHSDRCAGMGENEREKVLKYLFDHEFYTNEAGEPTTLPVFASLSWSTILEAAREPDVIPMGFEDAIFVLVIDLEAVKDRQIYDGYRMAIDATKAGLVDRDADSLTDRKSHIENMIVLHPGSIDNSLGVVAVVQLGKGKVTNRSWNGRDLLLPEVCVQDLEIRAALRSLEDRPDTATLVDRDLHVQLTTLRPEMAQ